jgi:nucleotide-binding universal stress UspA family protein
MREVLLHGGDDEAFDRSVVFARRLGESFGARLHVLYSVAEPLSAGWTAEVTPDRLPEMHQAMEAEARDRLALLIPIEDQDRLGVVIALGTGAPDEDLVRYANENAIDLIVIQSPSSDDGASELAHAVIDGARCAVIVLR